MIIINNIDTKNHKKFKLKYNCFKIKTNVK